jgi:hypothetical protein
MRWAVLLHHSLLWSLTQAAKPRATDQEWNQLKPWAQMSVSFFLSGLSPVFRYTQSLPWTNTGGNEEPSSKGAN